MCALCLCAAVKVVRDFSSGRFVKISNIRVERTTTVSSTNASVIGVRRVAISAACKLEWNEKVSVNLLLCCHTVSVLWILTPLCPLCTGVSQMNSLIAQTYVKTKLCMDMLHTTEVMAILGRFFAYFSQNLVAIATSLRPLQSEMSLYWPNLKPPCYK